MKKKSVLSRLLAYAGWKKYLTYASWVLSALSALLAIVPFVFVWKILDEVLRVVPNFKEAQHLGHYGWMAVLFAVVSMAVYTAALFCSHWAAFRIARNIRIAAMHHIVTLPLGFMDAFGSGKLRKIVNESSAATETYLAHQLPDTAGAVSTTAGLLCLLLWFDWRLGLLCLVPVMLAFMVMLAMTGKNMRIAMQKYQSHLDNMANEAVEYVRGIPVVKTFGQSIFSFRRFKDAIDQYGTWTATYCRHLRLPMLLYTVCINAVFAILIAVGLYVARHEMTSTFMLNLLFYIIITPAITVQLTKIMYKSEEGMKVSEEMEKIERVFSIKPLAEPSVSSRPIDNSINISNVKFRYPDTARDALDGVSLYIKAGEHIALVGPSGGGKTTLASIIARFWDVTQGSVKIGGVDVRDISKETLMDNISFVFQDSRLLKMSLLENIRMARPSATREEVTEALEKAQCSDIIAKLPDGVDTVVATDGVFLSGGEQQRLTIARAMLKNTPVIILDEATAFADPDNEMKVQKAFATLSQGKTVIMIAHRLSTVVNADRIYVLKEGRIAEEGSHARLLEKDGIYSKMWAEYTKSANWHIGGIK
ncbi:MAG: ABC transporter ATP-binding protein [Prevotella sp.]